MQEVKASSEIAVYVEVKASSEIRVYHTRPLTKATEARFLSIYPIHSPPRKEGERAQEGEREGGGEGREMVGGDQERVDAN